ncbi:MAG: lysophospholipid acyltransferase family protein [Dehalococcoidia bacterium]
MIHYLALLLLVRLGERIPLPLLDAAARVAGTLAWRLSRRLRAVTRDHMRHVLGPQAAAGEVDRAAREAVRTAARGYAEFAHLPAFTPEAVRARVVSFQGLDALTGAAAEGRGAILVSAHLGAPEMLSRAAPAFGIDFAAIEEPLEPPRVRALVHGRRAVAGVHYVPATLAGLREARQHLARGGVLGVLVDRDVLHTGRRATFFGERALMPPGAVELAHRTGAPLVAVWCTREATGRYRLRAERLDLPPATGDREADVAAGMRVVIAALEEAIRATPGQWFPLTSIWNGLAADRMRASSDRAARLQ